MRKQICSDASAIVRPGERLGAIHSEIDSRHDIEPKARGALKNDVTRQFIDAHEGDYIGSASYLMTMDFFNGRVVGTLAALGHFFLSNPVGDKIFSTLGTSTVAGLAVGLTFAGIDKLTRSSDTITSLKKWGVHRISDAGTDLWNKISPAQDANEYGVRSNGLLGNTYLAANYSLKCLTLAFTTAITLPAYDKACEASNGGGLKGTDLYLSERTCDLADSNPISWVNDNLSFPSSWGADAGKAQNIAKPAPQ